jgi:replicative DNA helicase
MTNELTKTMPHNLAAEAALLGSALFDGRISDDSSAIEPEHFYSESYAQLWAAMQEVSRRGMAVTPDSVTEAFAGALVPDLLELLDHACSGFELRTSVKVVQDTWHRRRLIIAADQMRAAALGSGEGYVEPNEIMTLVDGTLDDVRKEMTGGMPHHDFNSSGIESIEMQKQAVGRRIKTGFAELDERIGGFEEGTVTILAAATSMGKSTLAVCLAMNAMRAGHAVGYFTLEMSRHSMAQRGGTYLLYDNTKDGNLRYADVINGKASPSDMTRLKRVFEDEAHNRLFLDDRGQLNTAHMSERLRNWESMARRRGLPMPKLIVIDHMGNMKPQKERRDNFQDVSAVSKEVLAFAKRHSVAVLALNQINRNSIREERRPALHDLRQSGEIEEDAHAVMFLHRDEYYAKKEMDGAKDMDAYNKASDRWLACRGHAEIIIAKNRNGPLDTVRLRCDMASNAFWEPKSNVRAIWEASA